MAKKAVKVSTNRLKKFYLGIITSIAFIPTLIALALLFLSFLVIFIDQRSPDRLFGNEVPFKNILYPASARSLLGAIAGGMISLMVFSFSMIMVILNQTASSYSPRLLPDLVERRHHQVVMGVYLGTIAYTFVVLSSVQSAMYPFGVPTLSVTVNAVLAFACLGLFISFINQVSKSIQIGNIISDLHEEANQGLEDQMDKYTYVPEHTLPATDHWTAVPSPISGYLNSIDHKSMVQIARDMDITCRLSVPIGQFLNVQDPLLLTSRPVSEDERDELMRPMVFRHQENVDQNYVYGFKHLTEIATKALSPGINDPGTALQALDRLGDLFITQLQLHGFRIERDKDERLRLIYQPVLFRDLLYFCLGTIINYADNDLPVNHKLIQTLSAINRNDKGNHHTDIILSMLHDITVHFMSNFTSDADKWSLSKQIRPIIDCYPEHPASIAIRNKIGEISLSKVM